MDVKEELERLNKELAEIARFPDMNPGPVLRLDFEGNILLSNKAAEEVFNHSMKSKNWKTISHFIDDDTWTNIISSDDLYPVEAEIGKQTWTFNHRTDFETNLVFVYGTDITRQKEDEKKLAEQAKELAEIARFPDMNPGPVLRVELDGNILRANIMATVTFNTKLPGKNWKDICPAMNERSWNLIVTNSDIAPIAIEAKIGDYIFVFNHRRDVKSDLVFVYGTDISRQKEAEKKLEDQAKELKEIARFTEMNPGPELRMDLDSKITLSNPAATAVFGENLKNKKWLGICPGITDTVWKKILASKDIVDVYARIADRDYIFHHRMDSVTNLVFVYGSDITEQKLAEKSLRQSEKMATLGTLAAGVAHELNNPAAATKRGGLQLRDFVTSLEKAHLSLNNLMLTSDERAQMLTLEKKALKASTQHYNLDALTRSDREEQAEEWLENIGMEDNWDIAPSLVGIGLEIADLKVLESTISTNALPEIIIWATAVFQVYALLHEISEGSGRISEIVVALKNYSYLGQAPIQQVNVHEGIDNTLVILRNKLKVGITVNREYADNLPLITAFGSELNQVWTNILDNAADAMGGKGEITIRTHKEGKWAVVEIEDNGPGIPEEIQSQIFDPFFTTKDLGKGTGLGLSTSYGIVTEKHKGTMTVKSRPGLTKFTVKLPISS